MLPLIEERIPELSRAEQRVARWVLQHPRQAAASTLKEVSAACETSEPTVIRFCRHVGTDGFREFTFRLTEALSSPAIYVHRSVSADDATPDAVSKVMDASIRTLVDIRARSSSMPFDAAVEMLIAARQIVFLGLGASGHVAADACHKFFRLGIPCTSLTDTPNALQRASVSESGDVFVVISHSGDWPELLRCVELVHANGGASIGLTDPPSALAGAVNILFPCHVREDTSLYTPMSSRLGHLALLDALQVVTALALGESAVANLRNSKAALSEITIE